MYIYQNVEALTQAPRAIFHGDLWGSEARNSDTAYLAGLLKSKGISSKPDLVTHDGVAETISELMPQSLNSIGVSLVLLDVLFSEYTVENTNNFNSIIHLTMDDDLKRRAWGAIRDKIDDIS